VSILGGAYQHRFSFYYKITVLYNVNSCFVCEIKYISNSTRDNKTKHKVLQSLFKHAVVWKYIDKEDNPMKDVSKPKTQKKQHKDFYNKHELKELFKLLEQPEHHQLMTKCALYGGLRRGEVLGIV